MEYGVESVIDWGTGVLTMPESCVTNWDSLKRVRLFYSLLVSESLFEVVICRVSV